MAAEYGESDGVGTAPFWEQTEVAIDDAELETIDDFWRDDDAVVDYNAETAFEGCAVEKLVEFSFIAGKLKRKIGGFG